MKWMALIPFVLLTGCNYSNTEFVQYQQIMVVPPHQTITIIKDAPVDVTTTRVECY